VTARCQPPRLGSNHYVVLRAPIQNNPSLLGMSTGAMLLIVIATMAATAMGFRDLD